MINKKSIFDASTISLILSFLAILIAIWSSYTQYLQRKDIIEERIKLELVMTIENSRLSPSDLRILSGVEERKYLKPALQITNIGNSTVRVVEAGYQDLDMPIYADLPEFNLSHTLTLTPGEQVLLSMPNFTTINNQLTQNIKMGDDGNATIFATTTKDNRFEIKAIIAVAD